MRTSLRATIAAVLAAATLVVAATMSFAADTPSGVEDATGAAVDTPAVNPGGGATGGPGSTEPGFPGTGKPDDPATLPGSGPTICAEDEPVPPDAPPETPVSHCVDDPTGPIPVPTPTVVEPTPGQADVYARPFDTATIGADDRTVTIDFVSGIEPCYVLDHVDVAYGPKVVTITLFEGHDASTGDVACIDIGVFKRVVITLDEPLAGRSLTDGAAA
jgi:hypothetical protein